MWGPDETEAASAACFPWSSNRLFAFGSYGWGGQAVKEIETIMKNLGWTLPYEGVNIQYIPDEEQLLEVKETGKRLGELIKTE